jgi:hypothetical protein
MSLLTQVPAVAEKLGEAPAQPDRRRIRRWDGPPQVTGRPMRRSSQRRAGHRCGSTTSSPSTATFCCSWATAPRPRRPLCLAFRKASSQRIAAPGTSGGDYVDREGVIAQRYGSTPTAYLIRPHGYVGFRATGARFPRTYPTTSPSSFRRLAPVERAGSAPGPDAESDDLFDCSGTGARRCAIEGPVTTSKSLRDIGLTSCEREAAPHSATFG